MLNISFFSLSGQKKSSSEQIGVSENFSVKLKLSNTSFLFYLIINVYNYTKYFSQIK
jgi:hypothetical protein